MSARAHAKSKFSPTHRLNLEEWSLTKNPNLLSNNVCLTNRQFGWNWFVAVSSTQKREFCNEFVSQKSHQSQKKAANFQSIYPVSCFCRFSNWKSRCCAKQQGKWIIKVVGSQVDSLLSSCLRIHYFMLATIKLAQRLLFLNQQKEIWKTPVHMTTKCFNFSSFGKK